VLDVRDAAAVGQASRTTKPDVAFLAVNVPGGVDRCEDHPDEAYTGQRRGDPARRRGGREARRDARLLLEDYVFDGKSRPLRRRRCPNP